MRFRRTVTLVVVTATFALSLAGSAAAKNRWSVHPSPNPGTNFIYQSRYFTGAAATSPSNAWAVGLYSEPPNGITLPLIAHWDGASWTQSAIASPADGPGAVFGVAADGSVAWAIGETGAFPQLPLILNWDGATWQPDPTTGVPPTAFLTAVTILSPSDVWIAGTDGNYPVTGHWDGKSWNWVYPPLPPGTSGSLQTLRAVPGTAKVMAAGIDYDPNTDTEVPYFIEWTGSEWIQLPASAPGMVVSSLVMIGSRDGWAVGSTNTFPVRGMTAHWDGASWTQVPAPHRNSRVNFLYAVDARGPSNVWAVGLRFCLSSEGCATRTLVLHFDGASWRIAASPNPSAKGENQFIAIAHVPGTALFWVVGTRGLPRPGTGNGVGEQTLIALLHG